MKKNSLSVWTMLCLIGSVFIFLPSRDIHNVDISYGVMMASCTLFAIGIVLSFRNIAKSMRNTRLSVTAIGVLVAAIFIMYAGETFADFPLRFVLACTSGGLLGLGIALLQKRELIS